MRVWHDDIRPAPPGWYWARTNARAKLLLRLACDEISLDHDLGLEGIDPLKEPEATARAGSSPDGTGYDLVCWMIEHELVPQKVTIHSWNPVGARAMAARLNSSGYDCVLAPFRA